MREGARPIVPLLAAAVLLAACGGDPDADTASPTETGAVTEAAPTSPDPAPPSPPEEDPVGFDDALETETPRAPSPEPTTSAPSPTPPPATVDDTHPWAMTWDGVDLRVPSAGTELIGFHQSNHDGARDIDAIDGPVPTLVLDSRERGTGRRSAADIVVDPQVEIRAPVTGTVVRAGTYTLYCDELDDFAVIEPDGRPGIEVKMLHIDGVQVSAGDRVEAGVTVLAPTPTQLPFASQVDEVSGPEDWPHIHLEVVDTAIPDKPNPNSGSDDC
jgi:biotin carboxyl carrier protein